MKKAPLFILFFLLAVSQSTFGTSIGIYQAIHFESNQTTIRPPSFPILDDVATLIPNALKIRFFKKIRIEGFSSADESNPQDLSLSRAIATKEYLIKTGIDPSALEVIGYGDKRPTATDTTAEGRAKNRRVEFKLVD